MDSTRWIRARPEELPALLWSTAYFFLLLFGYFILRPVREAVGVTHGVKNLHYLFIATFVTMLLAVPLYGWLVARLPRQRFVPLVYHFFSVNLLVFSAGFAAQESEISPLLARVFFVWVSVFNLFAVSVFWSVVTDVFSHEQSKRLFGFIAAGGTAGALAGSWFTIELIHGWGLSVLLVVSTGCLQLAIYCMKRATRSARRTRDDPESMRDRSPDFPDRSPDPPGSPEETPTIGGSPWGGVRRIFESPLLALICGYLFLSTLTSTVLYFMVSTLVSESYSQLASRTEVFAGVNLLSQTLTLTCQVFGTARILTRLGVGLTLAALPLTYVAGFAALGLAPLLFVAVVFEITRRGMIFAVSKPALETLYTLVSREDRYKSKSFIDTVVYRGGDALSATIFAQIRGLGLELRSIAWFTAPVCLVWIWLSFGLRQSVKRRPPRLTGPTGTPGDMRSPN